MSAVKKNSVQGVKTAVLAVTVSITITILATGCANSGQGPPIHLSKQALYTARLANDQASLDRGALSYTSLSRLKTGTASQFMVIVTDTGRGPQYTIISSFNGMIIFPEDVPTGGIVGIQEADCSNLTCQSESSIRQPVLTRGQQATWYWEITGEKPGQAEITLRADTYDQGSSVTLGEELIHLYGWVHATPAFNQAQNHQRIANVTKAGVNFIETIGSVAGAIAAVGGPIGWVIMRRRKKKPITSQSTAATSDTQGSAKP